MSATSVASWTEVHSGHPDTFRMYPALVTVGGDDDLYLIGGCTCPSLRIRSEVMRYCRATRRWENVKCTGKSTRDVPVQHTAVAVGDSVYVIGGSVANRFGCVMLNVRERRWTHLPDQMHVCPAHLHSHASALFQCEDGHHRILTFGGARLSSVSDDLLQYTVADNVWTKLSPAASSDGRPAARLYHSACNVRDRYFYIFGGAPDAKTTTGDDEVFDDLWRFDIVANTWERLRPRGQCPSKRGSTVMHFYDPFLYIFGGFDGASSYGDTHRYDVDLNVWERLGDESSGHVVWAAASVALHDRSQLVIAGGFGGGGEGLSYPGVSDPLSGVLSEISLPGLSLRHMVARHVAKSTALSIAAGLK